MHRRRPQRVICNALTKCRCRVRSTSDRCTNLRPQLRRSLALPPVLSSGSHAPHAAIGCLSQIGGMTDATAGLHRWAGRRGRVAARSARAAAISPVVGVLMEDGWPPLPKAAFMRGLAEAGYIEGRNVVIEERFTGVVGDTARLREMAAGFMVGRRVAKSSAAPGADAARSRGKRRDEHHSYRLQCRRRVRSRQVSYRALASRVAMLPAILKCRRKCGRSGLVCCTCSFRPRHALVRSIIPETRSAKSWPRKPARSKEATGLPIELLLALAMMPASRLRFRVF